MCYQASTATKVARRFTVDFEEDFYKDFSKKCIGEDWDVIRRPP